jgi:hypothetical protein
MTARFDPLFLPNRRHHRRTLDATTDGRVLYYYYPDESGLLALF